MREILFRGKRIDNGEWVEGYLILKGNQTFISSFPYFVGKVHETSWLEFCFGGFIGVIPETVGQYTGLTDKNGRKIFIDDIVKITAIQPKHSLSGVVIQTKSGTYVIEDKNKDCWLLDVMNDRTPLFVIGNIHDNPELLEVEE